MADIDGETPTLKTVGDLWAFATKRTMTLHSELCYPNPCRLVETLFATL